MEYQSPQLPALYEYEVVQKKFIAKMEQSIHVFCQALATFFLEHGITMIWEPPARIVDKGDDFFTFMMYPEPIEYGSGALKVLTRGNSLFRINLYENYPRVPNNTPSWEAVWFPKIKEQYPDLYEWIEKPMDRETLHTILNPLANFLKEHQPRTYQNAITSGERILRKV